MIEIRRYLNRHEADVAKTVLESSGIHAAVFVDNEGNMAPYLSYATGVRLMVAEKDFDEAAKVLQEYAPARLKVVSDDLVVEESQEAEVDEVPVRQPRKRSRIDDAYKVAIIGIFLAPGIFHLFSLLLLIKAFPGEMTNPVLRRKFWFTALVDLCCLAILGSLLTLIE